MNMTAVRGVVDAPSVASGRRIAWRGWLPAIALVLFFWGLLIEQQRLEWTVNPVYAYGWAVPALAVCLFALRWTSHPEPARPLPSTALAWGLALVLAVYLPARVVQEANPDWVKVNWLIAALWTATGLLLLARSGGARYAWHFAFPFLFCFTALPWPVWLEESLSQNLMRLNATVSAEVLTWLGMPALAQGNLVQVADNWVNVEEACSGIRSLQTAFMASLFLGEFHRLAAGRRLALLAAALGVAFFVNLVRTVVLARLAGSDAVDKWHDTVGVTAMVLCLALIWAVSELLNRRRAPVSSTQGARALPRPPLGWRGALLGCCALVTAEVATRGWYAWHERDLPAQARWELRWPREAQGFEEGEFAERMAALLKFDRGATASWRSDAGDFWQMYYLEWQPGRVSRFLSSAHYPTVCLPATGIKLVTETGRWTCVVNGAEIPFTTYLFDEHGQDVYVFHAVVEDHPPADRAPLDYRQVSSRERLESVLHGERNLGQRVIGIALRGPTSPSEARTEVAAALRPLLAVNRTAGSLAQLSP